MFGSNSSPFTAALAVACSLFAACSSEPDDDGPRPLSCDVSMAKQDGICQVNFFCNGSEGPAAYCSDDGECDCGPVVENPKHVVIPGICAKNREEAARAVNSACDFGL